MTQRKPRPKPGDRQCDKPCLVTDCDKPRKARGYCGMHTERLRLHDSLSLPPASDRIAQRVKVNDAGCWLWQGRLDARNGYPRLGSQWAHRLSYELFVGPIPSGLHIDHLCRTPRCVNPGHLEPVTPRINFLRGQSPSAVVVKTQRCARGHEFTPENTYVRPDNGHRMCRECIRMRWRRGRAKAAA